MFIALGRCPRSRSVFLLCVTLASLPVMTPPVSSQVPGADSLTLEAAVALAFRDSPGLRALDARAAALNAKPSQAGALPDPVVSLNAMNLPVNTFDFGQEPMTQLQVSISQSIPFPGKRKLRRTAAKYEARAGAAQAEEQRGALRGLVQSAWWQVFYLDRALEIVAQNQELMRDFIRIAEARYALGSGLQQDLLLAQLELSHLRNREVRLAGRRQSATSELNALLGRSSEYDVTLPRTPPNVRLPELPHKADLLHRAAESRNLLQVHRELLAAADTRLALAERDVYPDIRIAAGYSIRQGTDPLHGSRTDLVSIGLSVSIPLYHSSKQSKAIDERAHEHAQRTLTASNTLRAVEAEIGRSLADYESAREQVLLHEKAIIPQAQQTVASMLAGYQVEEVDFLNVLNGQLALYNAQIHYWEALSTAKRSLAHLAAAVGMETLYE